MRGGCYASFMRLRLRRVDALRSAIGGTAGASLRDAAEALFEAGGRKVLPAAVQRAVRSTVEQEAARLLTGGGLLQQSASAAGRMAEGGGSVPAPTSTPSRPN